MTSLTEPEKKTNTKYENYEISSWDDENLSLDTKLLRGIYAFGIYFICFGLWQVHNLG